MRGGVNDLTDYVLETWISNGQTGRQMLLSGDCTSMRFCLLFKGQGALSGCLPTNSRQLVIGITASKKTSNDNDSAMGAVERFSGTASVQRGHLSRIMHALDRSPAVSYILDSQFRIVYCNPAWNRFARSNGAPRLAGDLVLGSDLFDAIPDVLRPAYSNAFRQVSAGQVWEQSYECSSPNLFRVFRMRIHLLKPSDWFVVTNTLVVEQPHAGTATADSNTYIDVNGFITVCAHCRCSKRVDNSGQWDFVPQYLQLGLESTPKVSHGLCPVCRAYFY